MESDVFKAVIDGVASRSISVADRVKQTLIKASSAGVIRTQVLFTGKGP